MEQVDLVNFDPLLQLLLVGGVLALGPLLWVLVRTRGATPARRVQALTVLTLFLTFDLVLFGSFTRLTDSGLGCPDWPGCYGEASPLGARESIAAAESAMPTGPVTHRKAWIEMIHRYLATTVGALIVAITVMSWRLSRQAQRTLQHDPVALPSPWWPTATLAWVLMQGAFGAWTVTLKLYPIIVTAHLLGGLGLLALLARQAWAGSSPTVSVSSTVRGGIVGVGALTVLQMALGGWVSTNHAVLACTEFPTCQGSWWPPMDFDKGFALLEPQGIANGQWLPFDALTAIHMVHRMGAGVLTVAVLLLMAALIKHRELKVLAAGLGAVIVWQIFTGVSKVVLDWPLLAAVAHIAGASAMVLLLMALWVRTQPASLASVRTEATGARAFRPAGHAS